MSDKTFDDYAAWRLRRIKGHMESAELELELDDGGVTDAFTSFRNAYDDVRYIASEEPSSFEALHDAILKGSTLLEDAINEYHGMTKADSNGIAQKLKDAEYQARMVLQIVKAHLSLRERQPETAS